MSKLVARFFARPVTSCTGEEIPAPQVLMLDLGLSDKGVEESWAQVQVKP